MRNFEFRGESGFPPVLKNLLIINVIVFFAQSVLDQQYGLTERLALWPVKSDNFEIYQVVTAIFAHGSLGHLFFNMLALWMFGRILEPEIGSKRFLIFYMACGIGASLVSMGIDYFRYDQIMIDANAAAAAGDKGEVIRLIRQLAPALGASGAVMGVLAAFAYRHPNLQLMVFPIPAPVKAKWLILGLVVIDLVSGILNTGQSNVGHFAHLGGAVIGFLLMMAWNKRRFRVL